MGALPFKANVVYDNVLNGGRDSHFVNYFCITQSNVLKPGLGSVKLYEKLKEGICPTAIHV